jgi:type IV pilus biogenesis protein PilP
MSLRAKGPPSLVACCLALVLAPPLAAQTIADYSRAQRTLLEATMTLAAARSAGIGASAPASAVAAAAPALQRPQPPAEPVVRVSGVFASASRSMAEVAVDGNAYLLSVGQGVPGTAWSVGAIAAERVVLMRRAPAEGDAAQAAPLARRIYDLPALR